MAVEEAERLAASGQAVAAAELLAAAARGGDADAAMLLAVWLLRGTPLRRDLPAARTWLRRAVELGHVDAALTEVALTANGSGAPADWPRALALLRTAAANDPVAAAQLALLRAMALDDDGQPSRLAAPETLSAAPRIVRHPALLTPAECAHLATVGAALLEPARVIDPRTGAWVAHPIRTSDGGAIGPTREDLVVRAINARVAAISGTTVAQGEPLTVLRYRPGQEYRPHLDTIQGAANQRIVTVLLYLNQGFGGGETHFPDAGVTVTPRGGDALLFANTRADGRPDAAARHAGRPVTQGAKWLATRWIRAAPVDPWTIT
ncbi:2OG-Fe(II) oxygenase [Sphingomonas sp. RHCKR7]|uniref:2OG-Fe(II) oxygenase n=1 Tax=Sphingomonas folli TaxID=2862497 RepID=UPI001CA4E6E8|nr:2OG-Fe(II) oxygenase [Sphingomonas folli]MBW6527178.1 2OG-Fe(II) oxygenase [Sphingomonas folli]